MIHFSLRYLISIINHICALKNMIFFIRPYVYYIFQLLGLYQKERKKIINKINYMGNSKWIMLFCYCFLNFIVGLNYISSFPIILETIFTNQQAKDYNYIVELFLPVFYVILGPLAYYLLWKSCYWSL